MEKKTTHVRPLPRAQGGTMTTDLTVGSHLSSAAVIGPPGRRLGGQAVHRRLRVLIADADPFARRAIRDALQAAEGIAVVADACDHREALELARHFRPDVVLVEMALPGGGGIDVAREIGRDVAGTRVAMLSTPYDEEAALGALRAGAVGYLSKDDDPEDLRHVVRRIANGEAVIPPTLARRAIECLCELPDGGWRPVRSRLTSREWEIVDLIGTGASTVGIADELVLSRATVYSHVKSLLRKLGVHSRQEAVDVAERLRHEEATDT
jgi:DNA-binding NarL/FixJ family response regulator